MNDPHDNAADDRAMYRRIQTDQAIEAFGKVAMKAIQLEMAEFALTKLLNGHTDTARYFEETEQIRHRMELKRADYARLGKLSKDETRTAEEIIQGLRDQLAAPQRRTRNPNYERDLTERSKNATSRTERYRAQAELEDIADGHWSGPRTDEPPATWQG
jgi:hypothetical protein